MSLLECVSCDWVVESEEVWRREGNYFCPVCGTQMSHKDVFRSLPSFALKPEFGEKRSRVLKFLHTNPGRWFTSKEIAAECGFSTSETRVALRYAITELQIEFSAPIVSGVKGFKLARTPGEIRAFVRKLELRKQGISRKQAALLESAKVFESGGLNS